MHSFLRTQNTNTKDLMKLCEALLSHMTIIFFLLTGKKNICLCFLLNFLVLFPFMWIPKGYSCCCKIVFFNAEFVLRLYINEGVLESSQSDFAKSDQNINIFCLGDNFSAFLIMVSSIQYLAMYLRINK